MNKGAAASCGLVNQSSPLYFLLNKKLLPTKKLQLTVFCFFLLSSLFTELKITGDQLFLMYSNRPVGHQQSLYRQTSTDAHPLLYTCALTLLQNECVWS